MGPFGEMLNKVQHDEEKKPDSKTENMVTEIDHKDPFQL